jgi:hypothetical protein
MGQAIPTINLNAFGATGPAPAQPQQPQLLVRSVPEIIQELLDRAAPRLLQELRESFYNELGQWLDSKASNFDALRDTHRESQRDVWEAFARKLGLPELSGGGYR